MAAGVDGMGARIRVVGVDSISNVVKSGTSFAINVIPSELLP